MGKPLNRKGGMTTPIMSYGKKKMKPEYWFSIPRDKYTTHIKPNVATVLSRVPPVVTFNSNWGAPEGIWWATFGNGQTHSSAGEDNNGTFLTHCCPGFSPFDTNGLYVVGNCGLDFFRFDSDFSSIESDSGGENNSTLRNYVILVGFFNLGTRGSICFQSKEKLSNNDLK
jgi:hypothetical protein